LSPFVLRVFTTSPAGEMIVLKTSLVGSTTDLLGPKSVDNDQPKAIRISGGAMKISPKINAGIDM
jgi:hypothetical protein